MWKRLQRWLPGGREHLRADIAEELRAHIDELTEQNVRAGMSPAEARRAAVLRFGNPASLSDRVQAERRVFRAEEVAKDLRFGTRVLRRNPGFTLVAILTLALGIGGTTAMFSVVNTVLLRPLAVHDPARVVLLFSVWKGNRGSVSAGNFVDWQEQARTLSVLSAAAVASFTLEEGEIPERLLGHRVTAGYFPVFGVAPLLGRTFAAAEDQPGQDAVVVLSEPLWRSRFYADRGVLGRSIRLSGRPYTVVGVMPAGFDPIDNHEQLWVPMAFTPEQRALHDEHSYIITGRLKPGVSLEQAQSEMDAIARVQQERFPKDNLQFGKRDIKIERLESVVTEGVREPLYMLLGAVFFVLLIACVNVGTLQLARARARRKEIAIRSAIGASSWRIVRQLLTESLLLSLLGGALGLGIASAILRLIAARAPSAIPRINSVSLDGWAVACALATVFLSAALSGAWAAARARKADPGSELASGRTSSGAALRDRLRGAMVVSEVALAIILLVGAGLLIRSALAVNRIDLGFDPSHLLAGRISLPEARYADPERLRIAFRRVEEAARAIPGVQSAALVNRTPMTGASTNGLLPDGAAPDTLVQSDFRLVTPAYFVTARIPLKAGRTFTGTDTSASPRVMVINETLARRAFPGQDPLGQRIRCCDDSVKTVIGVVGDVRARGVTRDLEPEFYLPLDQAPERSWLWMRRTMEVVVRTTGDPGSVAADLRAAVKQIDRAVPVYEVASMEQRISSTLEQRRFTLLLLASFAGLALFLAAIGIYGVVSYTVTERTQEIGIRLALGANRAQVLRLVLGHSLRLVAAGTAVGVAGALGLTRFMATLLFRVAPTDPASFAVASAVLLALALLASYVPAARALRIEPVEALR